MLSNAVWKQLCSAGAVNSLLLLTSQWNTQIDSKAIWQSFCVNQFYGKASFTVELQCGYMYWKSNIENYIYDHIFFASFVMC